MNTSISGGGASFIIVSTATSTAAENSMWLRGSSLVQHCACSHLRPFADEEAASKQHHQRKRGSHDDVLPQVSRRDDIRHPRLSQPRVDGACAAIHTHTHTVSRTALCAMQAKRHGNPPHHRVHVATLCRVRDFVLRNGAGLIKHITQVTVDGSTAVNALHCHNSRCGRAGRNSTPTWPQPAGV